MAARVVCGIDPAESTGLVVLTGTYDKPVVMWREIRHPRNRDKWARLEQLSTEVLLTLDNIKPNTVIIEAARTYPHKRGSTKSTIGQGENRGAVLVAVGRYYAKYDCRVIMAAAPDARQGRYRRPTKGAARLLCRAKFGLAAQAWGDDEVDAAVLALEALRTEPTGGNNGK